MIPPVSFSPLAHGGDLGAARALFPDAPEPFVDLSTAISPFPYPIPDFGLEDSCRLPQPEHLRGLGRLAAAHYHAPSAENVVVAPGSHILMTLIAEGKKKGRAAILAPTYAEHARSVAIAGHTIENVATPDALGDADLAVIVNPNNPDGRMLGKDELLAVAERQRARDGTLVVDEAFMDVAPSGDSLCGTVEDGDIVVLRSFGKFFGLAGLRLSFAVAGKARVSDLRARLGPWPVSGQALRVGLSALGDAAWTAQAKTRLREAARRLGHLLEEAGLAPVGQTDLFVLVRSEQAEEFFARLGRAGIFVRRFDEHKHLLRFGLPGLEDEWARLKAALRV